MITLDGFLKNGFVLFLILYIYYIVSQMMVCGDRKFDRAKFVCATSLRTDESDDCNVTMFAVANEK
jgi:hypothetical protein